LKTCARRCRRVTGLVAFAVCVWLGGCNSRPAHVTTTKAAGQAQTQPASSPERMPEFDLKDTAGHDVSAAQFKGKVVLLDFWATWCAPCKKEMPGYETLYRRYKDRGVAVVGIAADSDPRLVSGFGKTLGITYPLLVNGMDVQRYGVEGLPTTILVDRAGIIQEKVVGFEYSSVIETDLREILQIH
jgi:thiol-disulfide isomerase/thioredoxin